MKRLLAVLVTCSILVSTSVFAATPPKRQPYIEKQMTLLGLYFYGLNQELSQSQLDLDETQFLVESIIDISKQLQKTKYGKLHHEKTDNLLNQTQKIRDSILKRDLVAVRQNALDLKQACASCHRNQ